MYWYDHGMGGWGYFFTAAVSLTIWALVILAAIALFRALSRRPTDGEHRRTPDAERVLAERFAHGEIDEDEYRRRLAVLRDRPPPRPKAG